MPLEADIMIIMTEVIKDRRSIGTTVVWLGMKVEEAITGTTVIPIAGWPTIKDDPVPILKTGRGRP